MFVRTLAPIKLGLYAIDPRIHELLIILVCKSATQILKMPQIMTLTLTNIFVKIILLVYSHSLTMRLFLE